MPLLLGRPLDLREYLSLDETDILFTIKRWTVAPDPVLSDLSRRFINRRLLGGIRIDDRLPQVFERWGEVEAAIRQAIIFGSTLGNHAIPNGNPCAGTRLRIGPQNAQLIQTITTGSNGINSINGNTSSGACNSYLQLLDVDTCRTSNVERITP